MKWRKKPVVVEAFQWNPSAPEGVPEWFMERADWEVVGRSIDIKTLEGTMTAAPMDYVIKGVNGEIYPCKPDIFQATYEPA